MQWVRERGYRYCDLEGVDESVAQATLAGEGPSSGHRGTAFFKLGFGGEVALYPHTFDRSFHRLFVWPVRIAAPLLGRFNDGRIAFRVALRRGGE